MVKRKVLFILTSILMLVPMFVLADGLVPCGGPGEPVCQLCYWVEQVNLITKWLVGIFGVIFSIILVVSGFKMVTSAGDVSAKENAKKAISNALIGFVILLGGWLMIDFGMKSLLNGSFNTDKWNEIECVAQPVSIIKSVEQLEKVFGPTDPVAVSNANTSAKANCSTTNLEAVGMNPTQAKVFSCIAEAESKCNNSAQNNTSSARGIFQITRGWNTKCHNLNLPQCQQAVGASGNLDCSKAFGKGGAVKAGMEDLANTCNVAASNQNCNAAAALCLYNEEGGYTPWLGTAQKPHTAQRACVAKYSN